jgi:hypothetical protein
MRSAEEPSIQRPGARADHRQGCAEDLEDGRKSGCAWRTANFLSIFEFAMQRSLCCFCFAAMEHPKRDPTRDCSAIPMNGRPATSR